MDGNDIAANNLQGDTSQDGSGSGVNNQQSNPWLATLKTELRGNELLADVKGHNDIAQRYIDLHTQHGELTKKSENAIYLPGENATEEDLAAYRKAKGVPETLDGYEFDALPEGLNIDSEMEAWFRQQSHELGLSAAEAKGMYNAYNQRVLARNQQHNDAIAQQISSTEEVLKKEWGEKYQENLECAKKAALDFGGQDFINSMSLSGKANDPLLLKLLYERHLMTSEDSSSQMINGVNSGSDDGVLDMCKDMK